MDRRVKKTKKILYDSLIMLMSQKDINKITVKELTDLSDINRKTFYLHYKDIFDMFEQIKDVLREEFKEVVAKHTIDDNCKEELSFLLNDVLKFIDKNHQILFILLGPHGNADLNFINELKLIMKERCFTIWKNIFPNTSLKKYEYFYSFAFYGFIGLIQNWLDSNMEDSIEYMTELSSEMFMNAGGALSVSH